ncbi:MULTISPECIES: hypothetical protein [Halorussus]|uniref:hypothetical protein n=1 Tax=Halorussus TaxID=1070314 RepID=UPI00209D56C2|nr:hypothetical protein [Halorussus vallis]USZ78608.1 hypothetical protein NGM07_24995 [Halorussus vallis]
MDSERAPTARELLQATRAVPEGETPLLDAEDGVAEWGDLRPEDVLNRLEATEGRVALYIYGTTDSEFWLRYRPDLGEWEGVSRYPTGAWDRTTAGRPFAWCWLEGWLPYVHRGSVRLSSEFEQFEPVGDDEEVTWA